MSKFRLLFIDAYDSFSNNIIHLLETELPVQVTKVRIDETVENLPVFLVQFHGVVAGPGPGNPENRLDVGLIADLWRLHDAHVLPVLGVCLGFQSLVCAFGGCMERLAQPRHGIVTSITTKGSSLFEGFSEISSVQYHSLRAVLGSRSLPYDDPENEQWGLSTRYPELFPLAWDFSSIGNGPILMAVAHSSRPFFGIQFHPESICSSESAKNVIRNWWEIAVVWLRQNRPGFSSGNVDHNESMDHSFPSADSVGSSAGSSPRLASHFTPSLSSSSLSSLSVLDTESYTQYSYVHWQVLNLSGLDIPHIVKTLGLEKREVILLDSECRQIPELGRYSILGLIEDQTLKLEYHTGTRSVKWSRSGIVTQEKLQSGTSIFTYLKLFLNQHRATKGPIGIPFWGGLMGYITYEACLETIEVASHQQMEHPDIAFAYVERSIVFDHEMKCVCIQTIKPDDQIWIEKTSATLEADKKSDPTVPIRAKPTTPCTTFKPSKPSYLSKIQSCQSQIAAGNSYELCLTAQTTVSMPKSLKPPSPWYRYLSLRQLNPAPFAAFLRLGPCTILSTSPERFLSWTRSHPIHGSKCQFRPIKGTVAKQQPTTNGPSRVVTLDEATTLLSSQKETAENLMIVDLIRHDLYGVLGSGNVNVSSLMQVEEYESVYQLGSVIEGTMPPPPPLDDPETLSESSTSLSGIDVLAASLPPGSMTGAPKKRSCELLQTIEDEPRSIYSGVLGYMCVGGGDFSVVIRTLYKWENNSSQDDGGVEEWKIGAGGAITTLSNAEDEWDEMLTKLKSTLRLFEM